MNNQEIKEYLDSKFDFEIVKKQLHTYKSSTVTKAVPYYGLFRSDTDEPACRNAVGEGYEPHQTKHIIQIATECAKGFECDETRSIRAWFKNGHYVSIAPSNDYRQRIGRNSKDSIWPRILISGGLGGTSSLRINIGYWRDLCCNLAMPKQVEGISINFRHSRTIAERIEQTDILGRVYASWHELAEKMGKMRLKEIPLASALHTIFGDHTERSEKAAIARNEAIIKRIWNERQEIHNDDHPRNVRSLDHVTGWEFYNGIQGYYQHDAPMRSAEIPSQLRRQRELTNDNQWTRLIKTIDNNYVTAAENYVLSA
mgnify:CR=1 FL=1